ncbi:MAG: methylenetetrahydrofolate--tRNA-(uracil(54)-C(5))-methyltransferase (FADH(2)-oxidizing) TrmFO [Sandaracinaceae bacterium]|nr:methylenetetrahydrofolate--tRNA-(uracil(54)-C(5))-methyltransferase (FADH(2)-oxidizing) TrmFO [Sandaracinaceae bacterium]MDW8245112.1 methylenetetrahydrofolate--tRNA-(uracil(54)-C(5))-methyltransferase (FADH(2)-oxidizing) TrmFO [Sandaracinaceae bacterium]
MPKHHEAWVIGGGLAGCECAFQMAERGVRVQLWEQKPAKRTPAQVASTFAELVCSNSLRSDSLTNAVGLLKEEMRRAGSLIMAVAEKHRVPAGGALAVDRDKFSREVTERVRTHPLIEVRDNEEVTDILPFRPIVIATGPLTSEALAQSIAQKVGHEHLAYYDAISPIVLASSIDESKVFRASRYGKGGDDAYLNSPLTEEEYLAFVEALLGAEKVPPRPFEEPRYFEGCLPIEVMAERGVYTLAFGPLKPVGLMDPRTGRRPFAVVQLRPEDEECSAYNIVGFQTRMKQPEQRRVFSMIPGLEKAEFLRYGSVHRNTFVNAPLVLDDTLAIRSMPGVHLAGQITGVEGYVESAAIGLIVGLALARELKEGVPFLESLPPPTTALGSLYRYLRCRRPEFQPSNVVFSMFPPLGERGPRDKRWRGLALAERALRDLEGWIEAVGARRLPTFQIKRTVDEERKELLRYHISPSPT